MTRAPLGLPWNYYFVRRQRKFQLSSDPSIVGMSFEVRQNLLSVLVQPGLITEPF